MEVDAVVEADTVVVEEIEEVIEINEEETKQVYTPAPTPAEVEAFFNASHDEVDEVDEADEVDEVDEVVVVADVLEIVDSDGDQTHPRTPEPKITIVKAIDLTDDANEESDQAVNAQLEQLELAVRKELEKKQMSEEKINMALDVRSSSD